MNKISKTFKALAAIIKNPWLLNNVLSDDSVWFDYVQKKYNSKNGFPVLDINEISSDFSETLNYFAFLDGGSMPTDIAILKTLAKKFDKCKYFEIGTWRGESVANVADIASECYTLNLSKQQMLDLGLSRQYADLHGFFSKGKPNINHLTGNSLDFDFEGLNLKFDLIFIDGNHRYEYIKKDTENVFKHLLHENSIVVWHDYGYNPEKLRPQVMAAILDGVPEGFRNNLYHVSNSMCAIFMRGDFKTRTFTAPQTPDKVFKINLESRKI